MLTDAHGRAISYVRLAVTDRCNLRCTYCMPEDQRFLERQSLLQYGEIIRLMKILAQAGITKVRITGGEPFMRKDMLQLLAQLSMYADVSITTNGVLTAPFVPQLHAMGIRKINLSLDTLQPERFSRITRRDRFADVIKTLDVLLRYDMEVKLNVVVMDGVNTDELPAFAAWTKDAPLTVRFIEEMPFNGQGNGHSGISWDYRRILGALALPLEKLPDAPGSTALEYKIDGHRGRIGVIPAFSRTFCGSCNRIRITPSGGLKTCLYGGDVLNIRDLLRDGATDDSLLAQLSAAIRQKPRDGFAAAGVQEKKWESMSKIGG
ncbi:GTP 3',8-cyclase MoaA [Chitinophaga lutea]